MRNESGLDPEFSLLVRASAGAVGSGAVHDDATHPDDGSIDWEYVYSLAHRHGVGAHLDEYLDTVSSLDPPDEMRSAVADDAVELRHRNLQFAGEMHAVVDALESVDVRVLPFKGPVVATVAYDDLGSRLFGDVDALVPPDDIPTAVPALDELGYTLQTDLGPYAIDEIPAGSRGASFPFPGELTFENDDGIELELRIDHGDRYSDARLDVADLWENRTRVSVAGRECPALSPTDRLVVLTNHGSKHAWRRLESLAGVAGAANRTDADWHEARDRARERGTLRELYLGVLLTVEFFDAGIPEDIEREASADERAAAVAETIRERYATEPMRALSEFERQRVLGRLRGDRATRYVRYVTDPTAGDYQFVSLPEPLWPLYRVVRPIRGTLKALRS